MTVSIFLCRQFLHDLITGRSQVRFRLGFETDKPTGKPFEIKIQLSLFSIEEDFLGIKNALKFAFHTTSASDFSSLNPISEIGRGTLAAMPPLGRAGRTGQDICLTSLISVA